MLSQPRNQKLHTARDIEETLDADRVTSTTAVYLLLKRVFAEHCLLGVRVRPHADTFISAMLEVVQKDKYLVLDGPVSSPSHHAMVAGLPIEVSTTLDGIRLRFNSVVTEIGQSNARPYYKVPFPEAVHYAQRRLQHRVAVALQKHIKVTLYTEDGDPFEGELRDISVGGFCAQMPEGVSAAFPHKERAYQCVVLLPDDETIQAQIEIRRIAERDRQKPPRIGALFTQLEPRDLHRIERFVAQLDREQLRKR